MKFIVQALVSRLVETGNLTVTYPDGSRQTFGDGTGNPVHMRINSRKALWGLAVDPAYYLGHHYGTGDIDIVEGDMYGLLKIVFTGNPDFQYYDTRWNRALERLRYLLRWAREKNSVVRSRRNVQHHYDLTGALYDLFLDQDRQYSCAYFERPDQSLDEAQLAKKRHIAAKLNINRPGQSVLDIGSGWGGMALYLARQLGAKVTGVTLSDEQHALSVKRASEAGLGDEVKFLLQDYRNTEGPFDRIVSVGMFEHVGVGYYRDYFRKVRELLTEDGVALIHTIGRSTPPGATNPFIAKYIFPGGYIPAMSEVTAAIEKEGLVVTDVEVLRIHYAETLKAWRENFLARRDEAVAMYDERFARMWEFYLAASEASFRHDDLVVFQFQLAKRLDGLPITRGYIEEREGELGRERATGKVKAAEF